MTKSTLVQLVIIYVGIITMYATITNLLPDLVLLVFSLFGKESYDTQYAAGGALVYFVGLLAAFLVISKSGAISGFIAEKTGLDDSLKVYTKPQQLLSIILVALALNHLLINIPTFLNNCFLLFTNQIPHQRGSLLADLSGQGAGSPKWFVVISQVLLPCLVIIYCRKLTAYFSKNIVLDEKDMIAEQETVTTEAANNPEDD